MGFKIFDLYQDIVGFNINDNSITKRNRKLIIHGKYLVDTEIKKSPFACISA